MEQLIGTYWISTAEREALLSCFCLRPFHDPIQIANLQSAPHLSAGLVTCSGCQRRRERYVVGLGWRVCVKR